MTLDITQADDRTLVAALLENDRRTWEYVLAKIAQPIVDSRKYREMGDRHGFTAQDVLAQLCIELYRNDFARLRAFRFDGTFAAWLYWEVRNAFRNLLQKEQSKEDPADIGGEESSVPEPIVNPDPAVDALHDARAMFSELWHEDPEGAYALLMRAEIGLESVQIAGFLGKSTAAVDKLVSRTRDSLRKIRQKNERVRS